MVSVNELIAYLKRFAKKIGLEGLKVACEFNLRLVPIYIREQLKNLDETIIITSDHGEDLGEKGIYGHCQSYVLWFVIDKPKKYKNKLRWRIKQVKGKLKRD